MRVQSRALRGDLLTPIRVFQNLTGKKKFILESSSGHGEKGRYSFLGQSPKKEIVGNLNETVIYEGDKKKVIAKPPLTVLKDELPPVTLDLPFLFYGGAVGYIGYDVIRHYEAIGDYLEDELDMPDVHLMLYDEVIVFDHKKETVTLIAIDLTNERSDEQLIEALARLENQITQDVKKKEPKETVSFKAQLEKETFIDWVKRAKQKIIDGEIFQVVLSQRFSADFHGDAFLFYRNLRHKNPSPYMFYIDFSDYIVLGTSPESLIKVKGKHVTTNPIAGTRKRGLTDLEDQQLADELLADEKEQAEHKMLVDLSRNDLGRVCEIDSIALPKFMMIERYQYVMHIVSEVTGNLTEDHSGIDCLIATLPAGTVSGAPKIRAMQIINQFETKKRGVYAGAVGYLNLNGDLDLALAIRTMVVKDKRAHVQAGAGIVYDSDPDSEYEETINKAKSLVEVISQ